MVLAEETPLGWRGWGESELEMRMLGWLLSLAWMNGCPWDSG